MVIELLKGRVNCFLLVELTTTVTLSITTLMELEFIFILTKIITMAHGNLVKLMDLDSSNIMKESCAKASGSMIYNMDLENNIGQMAPSLEAASVVGPKKQANLNGLMVVLLKDSLEIISLTEKEYLFGKMLEYTRGNGETI